MAIEPCAENAGVGREERVELFRLVLLQRLFEDRVMALYRQGRVPGSVYTGRGQEAVAAGAGLALGPDDVVAPLNRELACHFARGVTPADVFRNFFGKANGPDRRARREHALRLSGATGSSRSSRCSATSCPSSPAPHSRSSAAASRGLR